MTRPVWSLPRTRRWDVLLAAVLVMASISSITNVCAVTVKQPIVVCRDVSTSSGSGADGTATAKGSAVTIEEGLELEWRFLFPDKNVDFASAALPKGTKVAMKLELTSSSSLYDELWLGLAVSGNELGSMIGAEAVLGMSSATDEDETANDLAAVRRYYLTSKAADGSGIIPMDDERQVFVTDGSVDMSDDGTTTTLRYVQALDEGTTATRTEGSTTFLWAWGDASGRVLSRHTQRGAFRLDLASECVPEEEEEEDTTTTSTTASTEDASVPSLSASYPAAQRTRRAWSWMLHGLLGFFAWSVASPVAVASAWLRRGLSPTQDGRDKAVSNLLMGFHGLFNTLSCYATLMAACVAVLTLEAEQPHQDGVHFGFTHARIGLCLCVLASVQVLAAVIRPRKISLPSESDSASESVSVPVPSKKKGLGSHDTWRVVHTVVGAALLVTGAWQVGNGFHMFAEHVVGTESYRLTRIYWVYVGATITTVCVLRLGLERRRRQRQRRRGGGEEEESSPQTLEITEGSGVSGTTTENDTGTRTHENGVHDTHTLEEDGDGNDDGDGVSKDKEII